MTRGAPGSTGTLAEPDGTPEPRFALQSAVNWMHALALIAANERVGWVSCSAAYKTVAKAALAPQAVNTTFEQLLMSLHHLAALSAMAKTGQHNDLARIAIMTWYYGTYCAASAMIAAQDGSQQQDHTGTANQWDRQIASAGLAAKPFNYRLTTLNKKAASTELTALGTGLPTSVNYLTVRPGTSDQASAACLNYLAGTRKYREWQITEKLSVRELPKIGLKDFRSKTARDLRDSRLNGRALGFLHQAFRYRGKANYRDALFLTYESQVGALLDGFVDDLEAVLRAFVSMAGAFCSRRVGNADWRAFSEDLNGQLNLSVMPEHVWS